MKKLRHAHAWIFGLAALALVSGCKGCGQGAGVDKASALGPQSPVRALQSRNDVMPMELMTDSTSPYVSGLFVDDQAVYLTTDKMAYRVVPGGKPQQIPVENGAIAGLTSSALVYWGQNALWKVPKLGGQAQRLAELKLQPAYLATSGEDFAWTVVPTTGRFEIQTLENQKVRTLYFNTGRMEAMAVGAGRVYFVQRDGQDPWRLGSVSIRGGDLKFAPPKTGPSPAKLVSAGEIYHYDLNSGEIRKVAADLSREEVISNKTICSPIAVAQRIFCPNMEGLWQLERQPGAQAESVFPEPRRITNVAANAKFITWLADAGPDRLSLMLLPLQ